jgi:oxygen-independent coproporphyrinogen-3 oxidase
VASGHFPIERGYELNQDDEIRRYVITELMCNFRLEIADVERRFGINFGEYFAAEITKLTEGEGAPAADGLVTVTADRITVQPTGRMFVRNICMIFDTYLAARTGGPKPVFSRTV